MRLFTRTASAGVVGVLVSVASLGGGCSSAGDTSADAGADTAAQVTCDTDPRSEVFAASLTNQGKSKTFQFVLMTADPSPPGLDANTWTVKVEDASGSAVSGATLSVAKPYMPLHLHASSQTPQITDQGGGAFSIADLDFFMVGLFQVTVTATAGGKTDSTDFFFCVH